MHIDTHTPETMMTSICEILQVSRTEIEQQLEACYQTFQLKHPILFVDRQYDFFYEFVKKHKRQEISEAWFFHIARRLHDDQDDNGYPLHIVLSQPTSLSSFLQRYGIRFAFDRHIRMYIRDKEIQLSQDASYAHRHLLERFGYIYPDFDFKGFAFGDHLKENEAYEALCSQPDILNYLYPFLDDTTLLEDFQKNSSSVQLEYLVPLHLLSFEEEENMDEQRKQEHLLVKALQRLYDHAYGQLYEDDENPVLIVSDGAVLSKEYLKYKRTLANPLDT